MRGGGLNQSNPGYKLTRAELEEDIQLGVFLFQNYRYHASQSNTFFWWNLVLHLLNFYVPFIIIHYVLTNLYNVHYFLYFVL